MTGAVNFRRPKKQSGSATVEFSLVLLPLLAIFFITVDVAWIIFASACIQQGAREGVRYAVTGSTQAESTLDNATKLIVQQYSYGFAKPANVSVDYYPPNGYSSSGPPANIDGAPQATQIGNIVKVTVTGVTMPSFGAVFRSWIPIVLTASSSDVLQ